MHPHHLLRLDRQQTLGEILPQIVLGGEGNLLKIVQQTDIVAASDPRLAKPPLIEMRLDGLIDHVPQLLELQFPKRLAIDRLDRLVPIIDLHRCIP